MFGWIALGVLGCFVAMVLWVIIDPVARVRLWRAPRVPIAGFEDGQIAKIVGRVRYLGTPLISPLHERRCACFEVWKKKEHADEDSGDFDIIAAGQDFLVEDQTGTALVRYEGARVKLFSAPDLDAAPPSGLSKQGVDQGYIVEDGLLYEGDEVAVLGVGAREPIRDAAAATGGYRDLPTRLVMQSTRKVQLLVVCTQQDER